MNGLHNQSCLKSALNMIKMGEKYEKQTDYFLNVNINRTQLMREAVNFSGRKKFMFSDSVYLLTLFPMAYFFVVH